MQFQNSTAGLKISQKRQRSQKGQSLVEYLVIVALVGIGGISIMGTVGQSLNVAFAKVAKSLGAEGDVNTKAQITTTELRKRSLKNFVNGNSSSNSGQSGPSKGDSGADE